MSRRGSERLLVHVCAFIPVCTGWLVLGCSAQAEIDVPDYFCRHRCEKAYECELEAEVEECLLDCLADPYARAIEPQLLKAITDCMVASDCSELESGEVWESCFEASQDAGRESSHCHEFCEEMLYIDFECGNRFSQFDECLNWACDWSDPLLIKGQECSAPAECTERYACIDRTFSLD